MPQILPATSKERAPTPTGTNYLSWAPMPIPREERFVFYLGKVCRLLRKSVGASASAIAGPLNAGEDTIRNFEAGRQWPTKYGLDEVLDVYVEVCGLGSRWEILMLAIKEHGKGP